MGRHRTVGHGGDDLPQLLGPHISNSVNVAFENYPDLKSHNEIADAMQQNMYLQREITAARELYNDTINQWNRDIFALPMATKTC